MTVLETHSLTLNIYFAEQKTFLVWIFIFFVSVCFQVPVEKGKNI